MVLPFAVDCAVVKQDITPALQRTNCIVLTLRLSDQLDPNALIPVDLTLEIEECELAGESP